MEEKDELRELRPSKGENKNKKVKSDGKNRGKVQRQEKPWKKISKAKFLPSRNSTKRI